MDIGSGKGYPSNALSNFAPHPFMIDGVQCNSMEGFLQSLKHKCPECQKQVCLLIGIKAKRKGQKRKWWKTQELYWQDSTYLRCGKGYQELLDRAFDELAKNSKFAKALLSTNNQPLKHTIGKSDKKRTVLTQREFCSRLEKIRIQLRSQR